MPVQRYVAVCCRVSQCVAVCCSGADSSSCSHRDVCSMSVQRCVAVCAVFCGVLRCVAVCCSVLLCVAVKMIAHCVHLEMCKYEYKRVLQCVAMCYSTVRISLGQFVSILQGCAAMCCNILQCVATCCSTKVYCNVLQRVAVLSEFL